MMPPMYMPPYGGGYTHMAPIPINHGQSNPINMYAPMNPNPVMPIKMPYPMQS